MVETKMLKSALFLSCLAILSTVVWSNEDATDLLEGDTVAPCSNGSAIFHLSLTDQSHLNGRCRPFDNCTRFCYNSPNCTEDSNAPPNQQIFLTAINHTKEDHIENDKPTFRCCASSIRLKDCEWKTVKGEITVPENQTISDVVVVSKSDKLMEVKICQIDEGAGQPTAKTVCFADVCYPDGYCDGHHIPQSGGPMLFSNEVPYGLLGLSGLVGLDALRYVCDRLPLPTGVTSISYPNLNTVGKIPIGGVAVATCTSGLFFPTGKNTFETTCTAAKTFAPTVPPCIVFCPKLTDPPPGIFAYSVGTCIGQLCPINTVATLMCPTGQMSVETATSACTAATTCESGKIFAPYTTQLSCVPFCAPLVLNSALYSVTYSPSNCAVLDKTVATVTCAADKYYPDGTTTRQSTCSNSLMAAPIDQCAATCPLPVVDATSQTVSYSKTVAANGKLLDGTVATVTCTNPTDIFADGSTSPLTLTCSTGSLSRSVSQCVKTCPKLTNPANGLFTYASGVCSTATNRCPVGTTAQLSCNSGYTVVTTAALTVCSVPPVGTCDGTTRLFTPDTSTTYSCAQICPPLSMDATLYTVAYSPSGCAIFNTNVATITCATGLYYPDATTTRTATCSNGILTAPTEVCSVFCPQLTNPTSGTYGYSAGTCVSQFCPLNTVATLTCPAGQTAVVTSTSTCVSPATTTCGSGKVFAPYTTQLSCVPVCTALTMDPTLYTVTYSPTGCAIFSTNVATVTCATGLYYPDGTTTRTATCTNGVLTAPTDVCKPTCPVPAIDPTSQTVSYSTPLAANGQLLDGTAATITCTDVNDIFSDLSVVPLVLTCSAGLLSGPVVPCVSTCPQLTDPTNGQFNYAVGVCTATLVCTETTTAEFICDPGYTAATSTGSVCSVPPLSICDGTTGQFTPDTSTTYVCAQLCPPLSMDPTLYTVTYSPPGCTDVIEGNVATVTCVTGLFYPDGTTTRTATCSAGVLTAPTDVCKPTCPVPTIDPTTQTVAYSTPLASNGQMLDGTVATITCTSATDIFSDGTTTTIVKTCSAGTLGGPAVIPCVPTCPQPTDPTNGQFNYAVGICTATLICTETTTAEFVCDSGYTAVTSTGSVCSVPPLSICDGTTGQFTPDTSTTYICAQTCTPLSLDPTLYTVAYSPPGCPDVYDTNVATITCATGLYYPDATTTRTATCSAGVLTAPTDICSVFCPQPTTPSTGYAYTVGTCIGQLCPLNTVATLTCPAGQMAVVTSTTTCASTATCGSGKVFAPQLSCVPVCTALALNTAIYTVTYSPSNCAIFEATVATITCAAANMYFPGGSTTATSTCTAGVFTAPSQCELTCPVPVIDPLTQTVSYSTPLAANGQLLSGTVATVTCTSSTDIFSDGTVSIPITCTAGSLVGTVLSCVKSCPKPTDPTNGAFVYVGICSTTNRCTVGTTAQYTCNSGYTTLTVDGGDYSYYDYGGSSACATPSPETCDATTGLFTPDITAQYTCEQYCPDIVLDPQFSLYHYHTSLESCPAGVVPDGVYAHVVCTNCFKVPTFNDYILSLCSAGSFAPLPATTQCVSICQDLGYIPWWTGAPSWPFLSVTPYSQSPTTNPNIYYSPAYGEGTTTTVTCKVGAMCDDGSSSCPTTCTNGQWTRFCNCYPVVDETQCPNGYYDGSYNPDGSAQLFQPAAAGQYVQICISQSSTTDTQCVPLASVEGDFPGNTERCPSSADMLELGYYTPPTTTATTFCIDQPVQFVPSACGVD